MNLKLVSRVHSHLTSAIRLLHTGLLPLLLCGLLLLESCQQQGNTEATEVYFEGEILKAINVRDHGNLTGSVRYLDSVFAQMDNPAPIIRFKLYNFKCDYYTNRTFQIDSAILYTDSLIYLCLENNWDETRPNEMAAAYYVKGDVLMRLKRYDESYQYYFKANELGRANADSCSQSDFSYRLAMVLYKQDRFREAGHYFGEAFNRSNACAENFIAFYRQQELLSNIGLCHIYLNEPDSALLYFNKALDFILKHEQKYADRQRLIEVAKAVVYGNQASVYRSWKRYPEAEELLKKSIAVNAGPNGDFYDAAFSMLKLARIYMDQGKWDQMEPVLEDLKKQLQLKPNLDAATGLHELLWKIHDHKGNIQLAYKEFNTYITLRDSASAIKSGLMDTDARERLRTIAKQYEVDLLTKANEVQRLYLIIAFIVGSLIVVIVVLIWYNWRRSRKLIKNLREMNEKVNQQKALLEEAFNNLKEEQKEKDRILRVVAHDLRNPIAGMTGFAQILLMDGQLNDDQKNLLTLQRQTGNDALQLITEILNTNKEEEILVKSDTDLVLMIRENVELLRFKATEKQQRFQKDLPAEPLVISASREKLNRVISNLIVNAIKFSPTESTIYIRLQREANEAILEVRDEGIGIAEDQLPRVFDMHTSAKRAGTAGEKSFGLGLSISKRIVEQHQGKIWIESTPGKGTSVFVSLPLS